MTPEWKALEAEIFPQRKSKRVHIQELQEAWAAYMKTLEKEPWWNRLLIVIQEDKMGSYRVKFKDNTEIFIIPQVNSKVRLCDGKAVALARAEQLRAGRSIDWTDVQYNNGHVYDNEILSSNSITIGV